MNSRQIQCLLEIGKELNFTRAAQNLFLTQPAVSRYITSLEEELGITLFVREGSRKIAFTEAGHTYYNFFLRFATEFQNIEEQIRRPRKYLRLGYHIGWNVSSFLPEVMKRCRQVRPELTISLKCLDFQPLLQALLEDQLDAILTLEDYPAEEYANLNLERITSIRRFITYTESLLGGQAQSPADFAGCDFFVADDERIQQLSQNIMRYCEPYHFVPKLVAVANIETVMACVENGLGAALLDEWCHNLAHPGVCHVELNSRHPVCLAWKVGVELSTVGILRNALLDYFGQQ